MPCFGTSSWVLDVVDGSEDISLPAVGTESKYQTGSVREQYYTDPSKSPGDFEGNDQSFHKVETAFEVSSAVSLNASGTIDDKSDVKFSLANCKAIDISKG